MNCDSVEDRLADGCDGIVCLHWRAEVIYFDPTREPPRRDATGAAVCGRETGVCGEDGVVWGRRDRCTWINVRA